MPTLGNLLKKEAADLIDANPFLDGANSMAAIDRIRSRQARWHEERLKLYPDLYTFELKEYLQDQLPRSLHAFIRQRMVGASEILTKVKIRHVVDALIGEDARWWHQSDYQIIFFERLRQKYPGCCDGRNPSNEINIAEESLPHEQLREKTSEMITHRDNEPPGQQPIYSWDEIRAASTRALSNSR